MASIEMNNLKSLPMEKLCFDLKLEALEQMEPRDVFELVKVNQGFQGMLVRDPSIVFGEHVYQIEFENERILINKFSNSNAMELNVERLFSHFSFVKRIRSCEELGFLIDHQFNGKYTLLNNLKSVNRLVLLDNSKEALEGFFSNFHGSIKKNAQIYDRAFSDQVIKDSSENFMVGPQLKDCEKILLWLDCDTEDSVRFFYNALLKAEIENVTMHVYSSRCMDLIIQLIMTNGIPSTNPEAACFLALCFPYRTIDLAQYPGMQRIDGENRFRLLKQANDLARNCRAYLSGRSGGSDCFREESSVFRRRIDSTKDCIYVYNKRGIQFLAFYIPVD